MDLDRIQELLKLMETHGLEEIEIEDDDFRVRLKKETQGVAVTVPQVSAMPAPAAAPGAGAAPSEEDVGESPDHYIVTSPIVGSFYRAPSPDAEPFVEVGDPVDPDKVVCIVEAMKVMNEVKAEVPGVIEKIFIESGKPVEYGQPLFRVAKS
ncbi:MAG: acetyl-CoA carboxylase biotin carboxyl carrier protein [Planctomycetota bacterium]|jgi:acetyl-CoA carboxylase biotin carboxyl carrier protein